MPSTVRVQLQLRIINDDDTVIRDEVILEESTRNRERLLKGWARRW
jgi:hypothetical protein